MLDAYDTHGRGHAVIVMFHMKWCHETSAYWSGIALRISTRFVGITPFAMCVCACLGLQILVELVRQL